MYKQIGKQAPMVVNGGAMVKLPVMVGKISIKSEFFQSFAKFTQLLYTCIMV